MASNRWKCSVCSRKHGSGKCFVQAKERRKLRKKHPDLSKPEIAMMARKALLKRLGLPLNFLKKAGKNDSHKAHWRLPQQQ